MAKKNPNKEDKKKTPSVNPELEGFDIKIDSFGEIKTNFNIDKINEFLNRNVEDKKLQERDDYDQIKSGEKKQNNSADQDESGDRD